MPTTSRKWRMWTGSGWRTSSRRSPSPRNAEQVREEIEEIKTFAKRAAAVEEGCKRQSSASSEQLLRTTTFFRIPPSDSPHLHGVQGHPDLLDGALARLGIPRRLHSRGMKQARAMKRTRVCGRSSSSRRRHPGTDRDGGGCEGINLQCCHISSTTHPLEPQSAGAADGPYPPLWPDRGLPDLQLRRDQYNRRPDSSQAATRSFRRFATPSMTILSSTLLGRSSQQLMWSGCSGTTMPGKMGDADLEDRLSSKRRRRALPLHLPERPGGPRDQRI